MPAAQRRERAAEFLSQLHREQAIENLRSIYQHCGREAFFDACDELIEAISAIVEHERRQAG